MKSRPAGWDAQSKPSSRIRHWLIGTLKSAVGAALIGAMIWSGQIDLRVLAGLSETPGVVAAALGLIVLTWPMAAFRWGLILKALGRPIPYSDLFHIFGISMVFNLFFLGTLGGDAARVILLWRHHAIGGARAAASVLADRVIGLIALLAIALVAAIPNIPLLIAVRPLLVITLMIAGIFAAACLGGIAVLAFPMLSTKLSQLCHFWPRLAALFNQLTSAAEQLRRRPAVLLKAFCISLLIQALGVLSIATIAEAMSIGSLTATQYAYAIPVTLTFNAVPISPQGIGVGELAFDHICRWLETTHTTAAYSSIFFAFRAISITASLIGLISFARYGTKTHQFGIR